MAVDADFGGNDTVEDDDAIVGQHCLDLCQYLFEPPSMTADEDGIGGCDGIAADGEEVAHVDVDAGGMETAGVLLDDGFTFGAHLEGVDVEVGEEEAGFDADGASAEADVPEGVAVGQVEGLEGEEADGHLGNHLGAAIEKGELAVGETEQRMGRMGRMG